MIITWLYTYPLSSSSWPHPLSSYDHTHSPGPHHSISYLVMHLMGSDLNNILKQQALTDEHVQFLIYQIIRGLKVCNENLTSQNPNTQSLYQKSYKLFIKKRNTSHSPADNVGPTYSYSGVFIVNPLELEWFYYPLTITEKAIMRQSNSGFKNLLLLPTCIDRKRCQ